MSLLLLAILLVYLTLRIVFWYLFSKGEDFNSDGYYSLLCCQEFKKNGFKRFKWIPNMVIPHENMYPSLGIKILSFFSEKTIYKLGGLMNTGFDLIYLLLLFTTCNYFKSDAKGVLVASLAFIFLPTLYNKNPINKMHFSITWRDFGRLGASLYYLFVTLYIVSPHNYYYLILALLSFFACFYGSQFAMQSVIFGSLVYSLITFNIAPIAIMFAGHLLILILDGKYLLEYYRYKYLHFKQYFFSFRHTHDQANGDYAFSAIHLRRFLSQIIYFRFSSAQNIALRDPFLRGLYLLPIQLTIAAQLFFMGDPFAMLLLKWYLTSVIVWLLTLSPWLKIFGEPDRYLEFFGYFPILIGLSYTLDHTLSHYFALFLITIALLLFQSHFLFLDYIQALSHKKKILNPMNYSLVLAQREQAAFLQNKNTLAITFSFCWKISYIFNCKTLYPPVDDTKETNFLCEYPFPNLSNISEICKKYQIEYFVIEKSYKDYCEKTQIRELTEYQDTIGDFTILKVKSSGLK